MIFLNARSTSSRFGTGISTGWPFLGWVFCVGFASAIGRKASAVDGDLLETFQAELRVQCKFVLIGAGFVNVNLQGRDTDAIWFGLQGILISASNASKLLWGAGRTDEEAEALREARRPLRESVEVDDSSPLNTRKVRNSFEHFDERLDTYFGAGKGHIYAGRNIGPPDMIVIDDKPPPDHFGHFDPETLVLTFWEQTIELGPVVAEARLILERIKGIQGSGPRPEAPDA